ncbi:ABC transporter substrate-binding protein [Georgenia sp. 10Sc9-8]|uniref:ABC transporter substrate-binding protein n=1 Tax=Georgenia halotolerans TaxID=3028317 RepID=A0ABT5U0X0_9MICO|nr:ABC transporter substrate-binding protein [Georgenia halotolerans]
MRARTTTTTLAMGIAATMTLAACGGEAGTGGSDGAPGETIKFGFLNGITGDYSAYYDGSIAGAELAIEEINEAGGVLDQEVELVTADNLSTVEGAVQGFSRLVDVDGVVAVGGVESDGGMAVFDAAHEQQVPVFCPLCGTSELDTRGGEYMFRLTGSDTDGGILSAQFARDAGYDSVALLVQNTEGASGPAEVFSEVFTDVVGGTVTGEVRFNPGAASYQSEVDQATGSGGDAIYVGAGSEAGSVLLREWERRGAEGQLFTSPDLVVPEIASLSPSLEDGVIIGAITAYDTTSPAYESYAERFRERTGEEPSAGVGDALQYDQYIALALAIAQAGSTDGAAVAEALPEVLNPEGTVVYSYAEGRAELEAGNEIDYHGASSSVDVNEYGNLQSPVFSEQHIVDGEWQEIRTIELDPELRAAYLDE